MRHIKTSSPVCSVTSFFSIEALLATLLLDGKETEGKVLYNDMHIT